MPTPTKGPRLGGSPAHQRAILANLATSLFEHGAITTTEAKARRLRPFAERLISKAKRGDLHNRRQVMSVIRDKTVVHVLFTEIGPRYAERPGGYTRITKVGPRKGDNAPMAVIELVEQEFTPKVRATRSAPRATSTSGSSAAPVAVEPANVEPESAAEAPGVATPAAEVTTAEVPAAEASAAEVPAADAQVETTGGESVAAVDPAKLPASEPVETTAGEPDPPADGADTAK